MVVSEQPQSPGEYDIYVFPVELILTYTEKRAAIENWHPVIAYGSQFFLSGAFLAGCADFLKIPWKHEELYFRIKKVLPPRHFTLECGRTITLAGSKLVSQNKCIHLNKGELDILKVLLNNAGNIVPRWKLSFVLYGKERNGRAVDNCISRLRKKIKSVGSGIRTELLIRTVRGKGYVLPPEYVAPDEHKY